MLSRELESKIVAGGVCEVYASPTAELSSLHCSVFDGHLTKLCHDLKIVVPTVNFAFYVSSERYGIHLPADLSAETAKRVVDLFKSSKIQVTEDAHFGALF